ncbi:PucR family transcriptional regulator [Bacillus sp. FJAT-42376]|uniref:PucR family transcriptional regulator n=1 Tax=Bacillus sp. FJAT-42376 TaxID=2014076 RepID=UPI000F4F26BA|nr:PucR family transcriptional regulator [Bacillus sp. FJAT-42376]AZB44254.1 PucR family transcriptional regulator [Bacillus sp. FJAT-42376]
MTDRYKHPFIYHFDRLEDIADKISEVLSLPITIEDVNHRLLAYSTHDDCTDPARISTIIGRRVPEKVINSLWKDGTIPRLMKTKDPIRVNQIEEVGLGSRVAISIWKNEEVLGFVWALEIEKKLSATELGLLKEAAEAIKNKLLNLHASKTKKQEHSQEMFWRLLTGNVQSAGEIVEGFGQLNIKFPHAFSVLLFTFPEEISQNAEKQIDYLLKTTQQVHVLLSTTDFKQLIILAEPRGDQALTELKDFCSSTLKQLDERFGLRHVEACIGGVYSEILNIHKSYREALAVAKIKQRFTKETAALTSFSELGIYQYLDILFEKRKQDGFENYALQKLKDYDSDHKTNLTETLEVYIESDSSVHAASKILNVHVNTLSYRLKRITQIAEIDLSNPNEKMTIYLDIKLDRMSL